MANQSNGKTELFPGFDEVVAQYGRGEINEKQLSDGLAKSILTEEVVNDIKRRLDIVDALAHMGLDGRLTLAQADERIRMVLGVN
jgi:hypothetical protein